MNKTLNILVTGCGGDIGQSVGKILSQSKYAKNVYGIDISDKNAAQFVYENFDIGPKVSDENYIADIEKYVITNKIDIIIPVSEHELRFFTDNYTETPIIAGAVVLMANLMSREIGFNKKSTSLFLKENNLPNPILYAINGTNTTFPLIAKPNTGAGSSNIFKVENFDEFKFIANKYEDFIFQEFLDAKEGEFTCCAYRSRNGDIRNIIFKRELTSGGYSGYGEVIEDSKISTLLVEIAKLLNLEGSINIQLRIHKERPVVFEINPRFSSTILFRHLLGFKDLEWSIQEFLGEEISDYKKPKVGTCFFKGYNEYIA